MTEAPTVKARQRHGPAPFLLGSYRKLSWLKCLELLQNKLQELVYRLQKWLQETYVDALKVLYNKGCGVY